MIKTILIVLVVIVVALLIYAASKPDTFRVQRAITIKAAPDKIFPLISDLHNMQTWSAWEKVDPGMKRTNINKNNKDKSRIQKVSKRQNKKD